MAARRIAIRRSAERQLGDVDEQYRGRVIAAIRRLGDEPIPEDSRSIKTAPGFRRIRVGPYRVVYRLAESLIDIALIGNRKDVYKRILRIKR